MTRDRIFVLLLLLLPVSAISQAPTAAPLGALAAPSIASKPLPPRVVYGQLFKHVLFLERQADLANQRGLNGNDLRNFYQERGRLSASEAAALKQIAADAVAQAQAIDDRIQVVITSFRAQFPGGRLPPNTALPPPPPELSDLQRQKDSVMLTKAAALRTTFGEERFQIFDAFVQREFAPHITVTTALPSRGGTPPADLPAFPPQR